MTCPIAWGPGSGVRARAAPIKPADPTEENDDALDFQTSAVPAATGEETARTKRQPIRRRFHGDLHEYPRRDGHTILTGEGTRTALTPSRTTQYLTIQ